MHSNMIFGQLIWNQFRLPQIQGLDVKKHKGLRDIPICLLLLLQNFLDTIFNPSVMDTRKTFVSLSRLRDNPSVYSISSLFASLREREINSNCQEVASKLLKKKNVKIWQTRIFNSISFHYFPNSINS